MHVFGQREGARLPEETLTDLHERTCKLNKERLSVWLGFQPETITIHWSTVAHNLSALTLECFFGVLRARPLCYSCCGFTCFMSFCIKGLRVIFLAVLEVCVAAVRTAVVKLGVSAGADGFLLLSEPSYSLREVYSLETYRGKRRVLHETSPCRGPGQTHLKA